MESVVGADDYREAVRRLIGTEVKGVIDEEMQRAAQELVEEQRKAIRLLVEEHKMVIKQVVEEEEKQYGPEQRHLESQF